MFIRNWPQFQPSVPFRYMTTGKETASMIVLMKITLLRCGHQVATTNPISLVPKDGTRWIDLTGESALSLPSLENGEHPGLPRGCRGLIMTKQVSSRLSQNTVQSLVTYC